MHEYYFGGVRAIFGTVIVESPVKSTDQILNFDEHYIHNSNDVFTLIHKNCLLCSQVAVIWPKVKDIFLHISVL